MFRVGTAWGQLSRIAGASTSTNVPPPPLFGLRKTHKDVPVGQEKLGPKVRAVVGAREAPNSRLGHFLSDITNKYSDCEESQTECRSNEEMRAAFERFNKCDRGVKMKCKVFSMDVKALYPSMMWEDIVVAVREMIENSE